MAIAMKTRWLKILAFVLPVLIFGTGFALTQVTFQNTSRINTGVNIFITQPTGLNPTTCPAHLNPAYINNPTSIFWNVTAGGPSQQEFFCIDNQGTAPDKPSVTSTLALGACPSTGNGLTFETPIGVPTTLAPGSATTAPVTIGVCAGTFTPPTLTGPMFTVTVT
jgi:hypothetical protein